MGDIFSAVIYRLGAFLGVSDQLTLSGIVKSMWLRHVVLNQRKQIDFLIEFNEWIQAGSLPRRACEAMIKVYSGERKRRGRKTIEERIAESILKGLLEGKTVAHGMKPFFNSEIVSLFEVGERTGTLTKMLSGYAADRQKLKEVNKESFKGFGYPALMSSMVLAVFFMIGEKLPSMDASINYRAVPSGALLMFDVSLFVRGYFVYVVLLLGLIYAKYRHFCKSELSYKKNKFGDYVPATRFKIDAIFPFSMYREKSAMAMLKQLSLLVQTNMTLKESCEYMKQHAVPYMKQHFDVVLRKLHKKGGNAGDFLDTGLLNPRIKQFLTVVSEVPSQDAKKAAVIYAGKKSTDIYLQYIKRKNRVMVVFAWIFTFLMFSVLASGFMDIYFNINAIFAKKL